MGLHTQDSSKNLLLRCMRSLILLVMYVFGVGILLAFSMQDVRTLSTLFSIQTALL